MTMWTAMQMEYGSFLLPGAIMLTQRQAYHLGFRRIEDGDGWLGWSDETHSFSRRIQWTTVTFD